MFKKLILRIKYYFICQRHARDKDDKLIPSFELVRELVDALPPSLVVKHYSFRIGDHYVLKFNHKNAGELLRNFSKMNGYIRLSEDVKIDPESQVLHDVSIEKWLVDSDNSEMFLVDAIQRLYYLLNDHHEAFEILQTKDTRSIGYYTRHSMPIYADLTNILDGTIKIILGDI